MLSQVDQTHVHVEISAVQKQSDTIVAGYKLDPKLEFGDHKDYSLAGKDYSKDYPGLCKDYASLGKDYGSLAKDYLSKDYSKEYPGLGKDYGKDYPGLLKPDYHKLSPGLSPGLGPGDYKPYSDLGLPKPPLLDYKPG